MVRNRAVHVRSPRPIPASVCHTLGMGSSFIPIPRPLPKGAFVQPFTRLARTVALRDFFHESDDTYDVSVVRRLRPPSTFMPEVSDPPVVDFLANANKLLDESLFDPGRTRDKTINFTRNQYTELSKFLEDPSFTICKADKKMGTCILDTIEYVQMAILHLAGASTYRGVSGNKASLRALVLRFRSSLKRLFSTHYWNKFEDSDVYRYCTMITPALSKFPN